METGQCSLDFGDGRRGIVVESLENCSSSGKDTCQVGPGHTGEDCAVCSAGGLVGGIKSSVWTAKQLETGLWAQKDRVCEVHSVEGGEAEPQNCQYRNATFWGSERRAATVGLRRRIGEKVCLGELVSLDSGCTRWGHAPHWTSPKELVLFL